MPLFGNKFSPKRPPARKSVVSINSEEPLDDLVEENRTVRLRLGEQECTFDNGIWLADSGKSGNNQKAIQKLQTRVHELEEENNMLRLRYEIMLNMLSETTAESHLQQREIEKFKRK